MPVDEIVDPAKDPVNRLRRFFLQIGVPVLAVILVVFIVVGVTLHSYHATKDGISKLSDVILNAERSRISEEVLSYLRPATKGGNLASDMLGHIPTEYKGGMFFSYAMSSLRQTEQIESFFLADEDGNFTMLERVPEHPDQIRTILLKPDSHGGQFLEEYRSFDSKQTLSQHYKPANAYDPRLRSWYQGAVKNGRLTWSPPVLIPSRKGLAVTASIPFIDRDGKRNVFALNISLQKLAGFLSSIHLSDNARIIIIDDTGHIIASPHLLTYFTGGEWNPTDSKINPKVNPVIARAYDQFLVNGSGIHTFNLEKQPDLGNSKDDQQTDKLIDKQIRNSGNYISLTAQLPESVQKWVVMIVIPEKDFSGFVVKGAKENLLFSLLVVALAAIMAGALIYQGHRMDRLGLRFQHVQTLIDQENDAVEGIVSNPEVFDPEKSALVLSEKLCDLILAHRVSIWRFSADRQSLICEDVFDRKTENHAGGFQYSTSEIPALVELIDQEETVAIPDAEQDARTALLYRLFMQPISTRSLLITPVVGKKEPLGVILVEDTPYLHNVHHIVKIFASIVTMRFMAAHVEFTERQDTGKQKGKKAPMSPTEMKATSDDRQLFQEHQNMHMDYLVPPGSTRKDHADWMQSKAMAKVDSQYVFPAVAVMNISFNGLLTATLDNSLKLMEPLKELAVIFQEIAQKYGLFYVRIMGEHLIAIAGCSEKPDITAPIRLAHAALDMRTACLDLVSSKGDIPNFGIGIDVGAGIGTWFGKESRTFNLWGPVVGMSALVSEMAKDEGTIQVTQEAYVYLKNDFLFRSRGDFFIPEVGVTNMFILAGRR